MKMQDFLHLHKKAYSSTIQDNIIKGKLILKDNTYYVTYRFNYKSYAGTYKDNILDYIIRVNTETPKDILEYLFSNDLEVEFNKLHHLDHNFTADIKLTTQQRRDLILSQLV